MKKLKLAPEVSLDIDTLMQPIAVLGNRGSGKTYSGQSIFEMAHDVDVQCIAADVIGKWWSLRLGADGKSKGLADVFIFGGKHGDFPVTADRGAFVAKVIVERRIHAVLDVSLMRKGDRRRFLTDFAEEFFLLKKQEDTPSPSLLFLEEAHALLPQKPQADEARMLGAFEDLVREGRNAGIGVVVLDQRPATVNKNCLALIEVLVALRTTYANDRKVYEEWIVQKDAEGSVRLADELPFLKAGQGFLYAPVLGLFSKVSINPKRTFDASATAKVGQQQAKVGTLTPVDMERVRDAMATVTAEVDAKDPVKLRQKVAQLERELAAAKKVSETKVEVVTPVPMLSPADLKRLEGVAVQLNEVAEGLKDGLLDVEAIHATIRAAISKPKPAPAAPPRPAVAPRPVARATAAPVLDGEGGKLKKGAREMLRELAALGQLTRRQLATRVVMSSTSGTFSDYLSALRRAGFIAGGELLEITAEGRDAAGDAKAATSAEVIAGWNGQLKLGARTMLTALVEGRPTLARAELAERAAMSPSSGTFSDYLSALRRSGCADEAPGGFVAGHALFLGDA